jgi:N-acetylmuramoyl-L-alanine amidase
MKSAQGPRAPRVNPPSPAHPARPTARPAARTAPGRPPPRRTGRLRLSRRASVALAAVLVVVVAAVAAPALLGAFGAPGADATPTASSRVSSAPTSSASSAPATPSPRPQQPALPPQVTTMAGGWLAYAQDAMYPAAYVVDEAAVAGQANQASLPLQGVTVVLDPGHGGQDGGAVYPLSGDATIVEKTVALDVALRTKTVLEGLGAKVVMTRSDDSWVALYKRVAWVAQFVLGRHADYLAASGSRGWPDAAETARLAGLVQVCIDQNSDYLKGPGIGPYKGYGVTPEVRQIFDIERQHADVVFVSLHCNSNDNPAAQGLSVLFTSNDKVYREERSKGGTPIYRFYDDEGRTRLAQDLFDAIVAREPKLSNNGWMSPTFDQDLAVLREENLVGVLVEMGFVTNDRDRGVLLSDVGAQHVAQGVADGLVDYFKGT